MAGKQAKVLSEPQQKTVLAYLAATRHPIRDKVIFLLSAKTGLRAKKIAALTWSGVLDAEGNLADTVTITDRESKGRSGRTVPMNRQLLIALTELRETCVPEASSYVVTTERGARTSANALVHKFRDWYARVGLEGASSHSGRRTFITNAARKISTVGGSIKDVQQMAGHQSLGMTQRYIDQHIDAQRRVVDLV